jgi:predicted  nucleic acid-binding Zn-ribbon protein
LKNETNKQQNQIQKLQDKINRLMKEIKGGRGKQKDGGGVLVHPQS